MTENYSQVNGEVYNKSNYLVLKNKGNPYVALDQLQYSKPQHAAKCSF